MLNIWSFTDETLELLERKYLCLF